MHCYPNKINIITLVWGKEYLDFFLDYSLKSQLTPRNIPELSISFELTYRIYTDTMGKSIILSSPTFKELSKYCKIEFLEIEEYLNQIHESQKDNLCYEMMMFCHKEAIENANDMDAGVIINYPDVYYAPSFFGELKEPLLEGKRAIFISAIRTTKETVVSKLVTLSKSELEDHNKIIEIGTSSVFPYERKLIDNSEMDASWSSLIFFNLGKNSFAFKSFNPNIFFFWPREKKAFTEKNTIDNCSYLFEIGLNKNEFYYGDSRKFFFCECSTESKFSIYSNTYFIKRSLFQYLYWMLLCMHPNQLQFLNHTNIYEAKNSFRISSFFKKIKMELFSFNLKLLYRLGGNFLKPFLYFAYLNHNYPRSKRGAPNFFNFISKVIVKNFYESELIKMALQGRELSYLINFNMKHCSSIRIQIYPELLRAIRNKYCTQNFSTVFSALFATLSIKKLTLFFSNLYPKNLDEKKLNESFRDNLNFLNLVLEEFSNKKKIKWMALKYLGRLFRKSINVGHVELLKIFMNNNLHLKLRKKYLKPSALKILGTASRLNNEVLLKDYLICMLDLYAPSNFDLKNEIQNYKLTEKKQMLSAFFKVILIHTSHSKNFQQIAKQDDEETSFLFLEYFFEHMELKKRDLRLMRKILESRVKNKDSKIVKLLLDYKIYPKISKNTLAK